MKIVHICLCGPFSDGFGYQENIMTKYHRKMGNEVSVITSCLVLDKTGKLVLAEKGKYLNEDEVKIIRLSSQPTIYVHFKKYIGLYQTIEKEEPDIIFIHGCQFLDINIIAEYAKNHHVTIYVDNHADFSNSARSWLSKNILHKYIWRYCAKVIEPYTKKFYGVLPARVDFLQEMYGIPASKCELLVMGADDELVENVNNLNIRNSIRKKYNLKKSDFVIVTGGKIDLFKKQTILLMKAIQDIKKEKNIKLLIFGSVVPELKEEVNALTDGETIQYIGWIKAVDSYKYFASADLVVFPGRHSVMWEQATGQGIPMLVKDWKGTHHVDLGGNVRFLKEDSVEEIKRNIEFLLEHPEEYQKMKQVAVEKGMKEFSYMDIAKRSIED